MTSELRNGDIVEIYFSTCFGLCHAYTHLFLSHQPVVKRVSLVFVIESVMKCF